MSGPYSVSIPSSHLSALHVGDTPSLEQPNTTQQKRKQKQADYSLRGKQTFTQGESQNPRGMGIKKKPKKQVISDA